ncbi:hypothetical protein BpHYR1_050756 [Brachionus plicatilis]|uniref:Uncharacterized protein n=1 Tax=Brachionus plicatilis TaxID=10195 RepID=A0A3M7P9L2_BRAPC|nr:hypothetical protein BpHYR1_050756 [Brachionus plicatilis]
MTHSLKSKTSSSEFSIRDMKKSSNCFLVSKIRISAPLLVMLDFKINFFVLCPSLELKLLSIIDVIKLKYISFGHMFEKLALDFGKIFSKIESDLSFTNQAFSNAKAIEQYFFRSIRTPANISRNLNQPRSLYHCHLVRLRMGHVCFNRSILKFAFTIFKQNFFYFKCQKFGSCQYVHKISNQWYHVGLVNIFITKLVIISLNRNLFK